MWQRSNEVHSGAEALSGENDAGAPVLILVTLGGVAAGVEGAMGAHGGSDTGASTAVSWRHRFGGVAMRRGPASMAVPVLHCACRRVKHASAGQVGEDEKAAAGVMGDGGGHAHQLLDYVRSRRRLAGCRGGASSPVSACWPISRSTL
ncbi:MAG: hypothetical protein U5L11_03370 [Arhodomonas sp.]|nr:hypothetical protein [Arhodomonas sp.]